MKSPRVRIACQKCRSLKHKCDFKYPKCSRCERTGSDCIAQDRLTKEFKLREQFPRTAEHNMKAPISTEALEQKVERLEKKMYSYEKVLENLGIHLQDDSPLNLNLNQVTALSMLPFKGSSSNNDHEITTSSIFGRSGPSYEATNDIVPSLPETEEECNIILSSYYRFAWIQHPILEDQNMLYTISKLQYTRNSKVSTLSTWDSFLLYITLAIGTAITGDSREVVNQYYSGAIVYLKKFFYSVPILLHNYSDKEMNTRLQIRSLQALLLICSFGLLKPVSPGIWYIVASAMRLCIDLDLQEESTLVRLGAAHASTSDSGFYRRLFWSCYALDRQICCYVNKPFSLNDIDITAKMIEPTDNNLTIRVSCLFIEIRSMQSMIHQFIYKNVKGSSRHANSAQQWCHEMHMELNNWLLKVLECDEELKHIISFSKDFLFLTYFQMLQTLFRPTSFKLNSMATEEFSVLLECANNIIAIYERLSSANKINYKFLSVYSIYQSGLTYFYCLINSPELSFQPNMLNHSESFMRRISPLLQDLKKDCPPAENIERTLSHISQSANNIIKRRLDSNPSLRMEKSLSEKSTNSSHDRSFGPFNLETQGRLELNRAIPLINLAPASSPMISTYTSQEPQKQPQQSNYIDPVDNAQILKDLNFADLNIPNLPFYHPSLYSAEHQHEQQQPQHNYYNNLAQQTQQRQGKEDEIDDVILQNPHNEQSADSNDSALNTQDLWEFLFEEPFSLKDLMMLG